MTALLEVGEVRKSFGAVRAVDGVSFTVAPGAFFALLGPSGCGKTTLLRMVAGFERPDAGTLRLGGADLTGLKANRRPVNLMFQSYALFPHMRVFDNIAYGLEAEGRPRPEIERRVGEALEMVKLTALARRKPAELSGGQRQRVALARALVKRPKLLLLDEPLGALDRKLRADMQIELKALQRETGIAFVVVTHDQEEALSMADTVCLLDHGKVVEIGSPAALYEAPATRFCADFIGRMNFLDGVRRGERFEVPGLGAFGAANLADVAEGARAALAVRPERVVVQAAPAPGLMPARLLGFAYFGADAELRLGLDNGMGLIALLPAASPLSGSLTVGMALQAGWPSDRARVLV